MFTRLDGSRELVTVIRQLVEYHLYGTIPSDRLALWLGENCASFGDNIRRLLDDYEATRPQEIHRKTTSASDRMGQRGD